MDITKFLDFNQIEVKIILKTFETRFSSHDFIEKFSRKFESEYIEMLYSYKDTGSAFKTVHSQIAKYLSVNQPTLGILKNGTDKSEHVFGGFDEIQWWINN